MAQQTNPSYPLAVSSAIEVEEAFKGDLLCRKILAERLTSYLDRLKAGAVIAIDAKWGDGKTWFGLNWAKQLKAEHQVIFIDAFKQDYVDDPFILIAAEIAQALDEVQENTDNLRVKAAGVMKAILPVGTKVLLNAIGRIALGSADISEDIKDAVESANDTAADMAEKWIEDRLKNYAEEKESLQHFKNALEKLAESQPKPMVIIIDELDRCRPSFAVKLIERIKHFFDVQNVVFVLLINRTQLEEAIRGVYGQGTNAAEYLGKFINFFFRLPKHHVTNEITKEYIKRYVNEVFKRYQFETTSLDIVNIKSRFCDLAVHFNLSLRDIERCIALLAFAHPINNFYYSVLPYVITLKVTQPEIFQALLKGEIDAHKKAQASIAPLLVENNDWFINAMSEWHMAHINNFTKVEKNFEIMQREFYKFNIEPRTFFNNVAGKIDLPLDLL